MLSLMRKYARSWFIILAVGIIVVVFVFWGIGGFRSARFQKVATVNGTPIWLPAYMQTYNQLLKMYRDRLGENATEDLLKSLNLREQALRRLVEEQLIVQAAERYGIMVTNAELQEHIKQYPIFQDEQGFNQQRYQTVLARHHLSPADFEAQERQSLLIKKVIQLITSFAKVSEAELEELFRLEREAVRVDYLVISPGRYLAQQTAAEDEMADYYKSHQEEFRQPDRARVRYLFFPDDKYMSQVKLTSQQIEDYYQEHRDQFARPHTIRLRQLVLWEPPGATKAEQQRIKQQAEAIWERAQAGEDFAKLVETYSQDKASRDQGGDLGYVTRGQNLPEWEKVAFSLQEGQVGLAHTPKGYYILRLEEIKETKPLPLNQVRDQVEEQLKEQEARRLAKENAQQVRVELASAAMPKVAARHHLNIQQTPYISMNDPIPELGKYLHFNQTALSLKPREISKLVSFPHGIAILQCLERQESHIPPFNQIQDQVRQAVLQQKAAARAEQEAQRLLACLQKGKPLDKVAAQAGLGLRSSEFFTRRQGFPEQRPSQVLSLEAFLLSAEQPYVKKPISWEGNYYVLAFKARRTPSSEEFQKVRDQVYSSVLEQKRQLLFSQWLAAERQQAEIKIYELPS
ncbi:MAG: SurA N-terminal domain-containing protein [Deltaproteobacteria bacterium]|nr:SurA N-terminal domain-containing protein [Deltaproteobacteria bacterium]